MDNNPNNPLVTIIVVTYNSSRFVLETLESGKAQTYQNIELIVSDDGSTDDTVEICQKWIENNKRRFVRIELITAPQNTGIPANCNRGLKAANGKWVKLIAGDDLLGDNCINEYVEATKEFRNACFIISNKVTFINNINEINCVKISDLIEARKEKQLLKYACLRPNIAPFVFFSREVLAKLGGFNEGYRYLEDSPLFFKGLRNNFHFTLVNENLVFYRILRDSISNSATSSKVFREDLKKFNQYEVVPYLISKGLLLNALTVYFESSLIMISNSSFILKFFKWLSRYELKILYNIKLR